MEINNGAKSIPMNHKNPAQLQETNDNNNANSNAIRNSLPANDYIDAIHHRFRENQDSRRQIVCLSCKKEFIASSLADIFSHYAEEEHSDYFKLCLYCQGNVHRYSEDDQIKLYHNCGRWRRNLDH